MTEKQFFDACNEKRKNGSSLFFGWLDLTGCTSLTSLPDGLTVDNWLYLTGCTSLTSLPDGLTVGGSLNLTGCTSLTSLPDGLTVGNCLNLTGCTSLTSLPDGLTVGGSLDLTGCTSLTSLPSDLTVGGGLYLTGCTSLTSLPSGLTVGGGLYLSGCTSLTSLPSDLTVGDMLYLGGCTSLTSLPSDWTVGGGLYLSGCTGLTGSLKYKILPESHFFDWGKYCKVDGIFTEIVKKKSKVLHVRKIGNTKIMYLVTDGHGKWAHGDSLDDARESLIYKIGERDMSKYAGLSVDTSMSFPEIVECYRVITGACAAGVRQFVESTGQEKKRYTIAEVIDRTIGQYGHDEFKRFFNVKI